MNCRAGNHFSQRMIRLVFWGKKGNVFVFLVKMYSYSSYLNVFLFQGLEFSCIRIPRETVTTPNCLGSRVKWLYHYVHRILVRLIKQRLKSKFEIVVKQYGLRHFSRSFLSCQCYQNFLQGTMMYILHDTSIKTNETGIIGFLTWVAGPM